MADDLTIRDMKSEDVKSIIAIDKKIVGKDRASTWQQKVQSYLETFPFKCLVGEVGGKVVGFLLGDIRGWEYGLPPTGWLELVGVAPDYQGRGIGRKLIAAFVDYCRSRKVSSVHAMVKDEDSRLQGFLSATGFQKGHLVVLEHKV